MPLSVKNLFKRYGNDWVLKDLSFDVAAGEVFGIFGAAGAGKTTLLKVLAGIEGSNGGSIEWQAREITDVPVRGFTSNLGTNNRWRSVFGKSEKPISPLEKLDKALAGSGDLVLLDEPFNGLDANARTEAAKRIREKAANGMTVILASSNYDDIFEACDHVAVLAHKDIKQVGTPVEVYEHPNSLAVAACVGRNNIFSGRRLTSSKSDHPEFITITGEHRLFTQKADIKTLGPINSNIMLAIRPENITISFGASFPEDNLLKAVVTGVKPRGAYTLVELDSNGLKLEALVLRLVGLDTGDECMLGLPPDRIQVLAG